MMRWRVFEIKWTSSGNSIIYIYSESTMELVDF